MPPSHFSRRARERANERPVVPSFLFLFSFLALVNIFSLSSVSASLFATVQASFWKECKSRNQRKRRPRERKEKTMAEKKKLHARSTIPSSLFLRALPAQRRPLANPPGPQASRMMLGVAQESSLDKTTVGEPREKEAIDPFFSISFFLSPFFGHHHHHHLKTPPSSQRDPPPWPPRPPSSPSGPLRSPSGAR